MDSLQRRDFEKLKGLSELLDSQFKGPFGIRFGLDGILGLIPFVGDSMTSSASLYIVWQAWRMGCSTSTLIRMGLNIIFENIVDVIPVLGHVFDFYWKANNKNIILLEKHFANPSMLKKQSSLVIFTIVTCLVSVLLLSILSTVWLFKTIFSWF